MKGQWAAHKWCLTIRRILVAGSMAVACFGLRPSESCFSIVDGKQYGQCNNVLLIRTQ